MATSLKKSLTQSLFYPKHFVEGRLQKPNKSQNDLQPGEGAIIEVRGEKVAAYKNKKAEMTTLSPVCTHLGCIVGWNNDDKTWDCPCHGSRYEADGTVKQGPAKKNLKKVQL